MNSEERKIHGAVIDDFLRTLNRQSDEYILKGGTALMCCYGLNRFSEDIDLDSHNRRGIRRIVSDFCREKGYNFRLAKDTQTTLRYMIHYSDVNKPLKIEVSFRNRNIFEKDVHKINGITVYDINNLCIMKASAYMSRDKIRDLFDLTFIINHYKDSLNRSALFVAEQAFAHKGMEQFDYLIATQEDELIDKDKLANEFLDAIDNLNLIDEPKERQKEQSVPKRRSVSERAEDAAEKLKNSIHVKHEEKEHTR